MSKAEEELIRTFIDFGVKRSAAEASVEGFLHRLTNGYRYVFDLGVIEGHRQHSECLDSARCSYRFPTSTSAETHNFSEMDFAQLLKQLRLRHKLKQRQLADAAGFSQSEISELENRTRSRPGLRTAMRILAALGYRLVVESISIEAPHERIWLQDIQIEFEKE